MQALLRVQRAYRRQRRFVRIGIPFCFFMVGGSFGLQQFTSLRYEIRPVTRLAKEEMERQGIKLKDESETNIEIIYETQVKDLDTDSWENVRGPRPWEDGGASVDKMKQKAIKDRKIGSKPVEQHAAEG